MQHDRRRALLALFLCGHLFCGGPRAAFAAEPASTPVDSPGFKPLFNGKDLDGWEGNADLWKVVDGVLVGDSPGIDHNEFLATKKTYRDFELRLEFRLKDGEGNSGVQFRSKRIPGETAVQGYQADIGEEYWGCLYDEHRRNKVLVKPPAGFDKNLKKGEWNRYTIRAVGDEIIMELNGVRTVKYTEIDADIARDGIIAVQIHSGPAMRIEFRNVRLRELRKID